MSQQLNNAGAGAGAGAGASREKNVAQADAAIVDKEAVSIILHIILFIISYLSSFVAFSRRLPPIPRTMFKERRQKMMQHLLHGMM